MWKLVLEKRGPPFVYHYLAIGQLTALVKKPASSPGGVPDARPVNVGFVDRRVVKSSLVSAARDELQRHLEPRQLAIGTKNGCAALVWGLRHTLEQHPDWVCVSLDLKNAHNAFDRAKAMVSMRSTVVGREMREREGDAH